MPSYRTYQIIRSVNDLPPRDVKVFPLTNPIDIDLVQTHNEIAIDIVVDNRDAAATLSISISDQDAFTLSESSAFAASDVLIQRFRVSGSTSGTVVVHVISIDLLRKLNAVEVR